MSFCVADSVFLDSCTQTLHISTLQTPYLFTLQTRYFPALLCLSTWQTLQTLCLCYFADTVSFYVADTLPFYITNTVIFNVAYATDTVSFLRCRHCIFRDSCTQTLYLARWQTLCLSTLKTLYFSTLQTPGLCTLQTQCLFTSHTLYPSKYGVATISRLL